MKFLDVEILLQTKSYIYIKVKKQMFIGEDFNFGLNNFRRNGIVISSVSKPEMGSHITDKYGLYAEIFVRGHDMSKNNKIIAISKKLYPLFKRTVIEYNMWCSFKRKCL